MISVPGELIIGLFSFICGWLSRDFVVGWMQKKKEEKNKDVPN